MYQPSELQRLQSHYPFTIEIDLTVTDTKKIRDWCYENILAQSSVELARDHDGMLWNFFPSKKYNYITCFFKNEEDAILFALTWS